MKQNVDYTLIDTDGYDFFGVLNVRCPCCKSGPGHPCSFLCLVKDERTFHRNDVLIWMKEHFLWGSDDLGGIKLREWRAMRPGKSGMNNNALADYRKMRLRAIHEGRLSSLRVLHEWDDRLAKLKLKGVPLI